VSAILNKETDITFWLWPVDTHVI